MHTIEIAIDHDEAEEFAHYLKSRGHDARVGRSTGNYVDGEWTSVSEHANETMRALWESYCDS